MFSRSGDLEEKAAVVTLRI